MKHLIIILLLLFTSSLSAQLPKSEDPKRNEEVIKEFFFDNDSLSVVMETLENAFEVKISFEDEKLKGCLLGGGIMGSLEEIFEMLEAIFDWKIKYVGNRYIVSGKPCY